MPVRSSISKAVMVPSLLDADLCLDAVVAGMDVGDETLDAVGDEFDRPLEQLRQRHRRHLVGIGVHLDAERAADILGEHAHLMFGETEMLGEQVLHHVRRLRALIDGQALLAFVPVGDDGARLVGHAGVAAEDERGLDDGVGFGEGLVDGADIELALKAEIVAEIRMDHRRLAVERGFRIGDRRQLLVVDLDQFAGVLGLGARARDDGADRFALPAGALDGDRRLRRRFQSLEMREHADPGRHDLGDLGAGDDGDDARRLFCGFGSILTMRACACGERTKATCAMRGSATSLTYCPRPCVSRCRFGRGTERPI